MWPFPADLMRARAILTKVNNPENDVKLIPLAPRQRHAAAARARHRNTAVYNSAIALATSLPIGITSPRIVTWEIELARGTVKCPVSHRVTPLEDSEDTGGHMTILSLGQAARLLPAPATTMSWWRWLRTTG